MTFKAGRVMDYELQVTSCGLWVESLQLTN